MHFATIAASILALAASGFAAPSPASPANTRYVQLRLFGAPGCFAENLGELGVYGDAVNACQTLGDSTIESVSFEYAINNCTGEFIIIIVVYYYSGGFYMWVSMVAIQD